MTRTLKDVYIKVTDRNVEELRRILSTKVDVKDIVYFYADDVYCFGYNPVEGVQVSLSELKRLIDTIPTREEITRLKRQISAYKTNLSLTNERYKELQSDNQRLNNINLTLKQTNNGLYDREDDLLNRKEELNKMYDDLVVESEKKQNLLKNLYDDALKSVDFYKDQLITQENRHNDFVSYKNLEHKNEIGYFKENIASLRNEIEQLKNKKWWQIWK